MKFVANDAEEVLTVHADHLGAPQKMTDDSRAVVWDAAFTPFGEEDSILGSGVNHWRFPGQYADEEAGLSYNWFRTYDPALGRYLQSDPIGLTGGLNTYACVEGNPLSYVDPTGEVMSGWCGPYAEYYDPLCSMTGDPLIGGAGGRSPGHSQSERATAKPTVGVAEEMATTGKMCPVPTGKRESLEKKALRDMAESDKRRGITKENLQAYKALNDELGLEGFPQGVRGPEKHTSGGPHSQQSHGHVGPIDHIPIKSK